MTEQQLRRHRDRSNKDLRASGPYQPPQYNQSFTLCVLVGGGAGVCVCWKPALRVTHTHTHRCYSNRVT